MIFCGDTVFPFDKIGNKFNLAFDFQAQPKILNLEALTLDPTKERKIAAGVALNNHNKVFEVLQSLNVNAVSLANNHITDFDVSIKAQIEYLNNHNIQAFGAGDNLEQAKRPFFYEENDQMFAVFSFGWDVVKCQHATEDKRGVNPMDYLEVFSQVERLKKEKPDINIILTFHTNYEFELYPQPAHRMMFFDLIDIGVKAIICHHTHIVGGYEVYKNAPIFYSLGNFYIPDANFSGFELKNPAFTRTGLCVDFNIEVDNIQLYWVNNNDHNQLTIISKEMLKNSKTMEELSVFRDMTHDEYLVWFKKNRKKTKLLPIYKNYKSKSENILNSLIVQYRQKAIDFLVRHGLKSY